MLTSPSCFFNSAFSLTSRDTFSASSLGAFLIFSSTICLFSCAFSYNTLASLPLSEILASCSFLWSSVFSAFKTKTGSARSEYKEPRSRDCPFQYGPEKELDLFLRRIFTPNSFAVLQVTERFPSCGLGDGRGEGEIVLPALPFSIELATLTDSFEVSFSLYLSFIVRISCLSVVISS